MMSGRCDVACCDDTVVVYLFVAFRFQIELIPASFDCTWIALFIICFVVAYHSRVQINYYLFATTSYSIAAR